MKGIIKTVSALSLLMALSLSLQPMDAEARRGRGGKTAQTRLIQVIEMESGAELVAKYRNRGDRARLVLAAEGFEVGEEIGVYVDDTFVGSMVVEETDEGVAAEMAFRESDWPAGLSMTLSAGTMVSFVNSDDELIAEAALEEK